MKKENIIIIAFVLSGISALIYEIAWIKPITLVFQSTTYVISIILASFMFGLAVGSFFVGKYESKIQKPLLTYSLIEIMIGLYGLLLLRLFTILPIVNEHLSSIYNPFFYNIIQFISVFSLLIIPTSLMGATFPILSKVYVTDKIGKKVGELYASNNIGAIIGSLSAGFILIPFIGIKWTIVTAASLNILAGIIIISSFHKEILKKTVFISLPIFLVLAYYGHYSITSVYSEGIIGSGKDYLGDRKILFYDEGLYGSVSILQESEDSHIKRLLINGQGSSSLRLNDVRVSTLLGFIPVLAKPQSSEVLVIGFGTGATSNILSKHFRTTTLEIEPVVVQTASYFNQINDNVLENENHTIVYEDGRNYLLKNKKKYDIIVNHPLEPFQSSSSILFTKNFFDIVERRLTENGVYVQWLPLYHLNQKDFLNFMYTLNSTFPYYIGFINMKEGEIINFTLKDENGNLIKEIIRIDKNSGEMIIIASKKPLANFSLYKNYELLSNYDKEYLKMTSLNSPEAIQNLIITDNNIMSKSFKNQKIITDDRPTLEFTTPINKIRGESIVLK